VVARLENDVLEGAAFTVVEHTVRIGDKEGGLHGRLEVVRSRRRANTRIGAVRGGLREDRRNRVARGANAGPSDRSGNSIEGVLIGNCHFWFLTQMP
jgi:hypothetical protein